MVLLGGNTCHFAQILDFPVITVAPRCPRLRCDNVNAPASSSGSRHLNGGKQWNSGPAHWRKDGSSLHPARSKRRPCCCVIWAQVAATLVLCRHRCLADSLCGAAVVLCCTANLQRHRASRAAATGVPGHPGGNPYLFLGGLDQALSVLSVRLGSGSVQEEIVKGHAGTGYVAEKDLASSGPIMLITSESESPESSLQMLDDVLKVVPQNLVIMQDQLNVPASSRITAMTIVRENEALIDRKSQLRAVLAAVAVGGCITVLVTGLLDRLITSRKGTKRRRRQHTGVQDQPLEDTPPTAEQDGSSRSGFRIGRPVLAGHRASEGPPPLPQVEKKEEFPTMASNK